MEALWNEAKAAGLKAAAEEDARLGPESARGLDCGFGWVVIKPARGPFVKWLKANKVGRSHYGGGWSIWHSYFSLSTQSLSVHYAAAKAVAAVLNARGINAYADSRYD